MLSPCCLRAASIFTVGTGIQLLWLETLSIYSHKPVIFIFLCCLPLFSSPFLTFSVPHSWCASLAILWRSQRIPCFSMLSLSATSRLLNRVHIRLWNDVGSRHELGSMSLVLPPSDLLPPFCLYAVTLLQSKILIHWSHLRLSKTWFVSKGDFV